MRQVMRQVTRAMVHASVTAVVWGSREHYEAVKGSWCRVRELGRGAHDVFSTGHSTATIRLGCEGLNRLRVLLRYSILCTLAYGEGQPEGSGDDGCGPDLFQV